MTAERDTAVESAPRGFDALVLAGGRGSRLGGADKAAIRLGGARLVDRAVAAARAAGAERIIVAGPESSGSSGVVVVREDPPFAGPLAALAAALPEARSERLLVLSCDLVDPVRVCGLLLGGGGVAGDAGGADGAMLGADGAMLVDEDGRSQWLAGIYLTESLRSGVARLGGDVRNAPLRLLFDGLELRRIGAPNAATADIDDPEDLARAHATAGGAIGTARETPAPGQRDEERTMNANPRHLPPEALDEWLAEAAAELGLDPSDVRIGTVLDVARDVAHGVARPAAPLTTFLLGLAVGRAGDADALAAAAERVTALAARWEASRAEG